MQVQWLKNQQRDVFVKYKLFMLLGIIVVELILLVIGLIIAQVLAGHYSVIAGYSMWLVVISCNTALALSNTMLLNAQFNIVSVYLPNQNKLFANFLLALYGLWPMLCFLLPSGFLLLIDNDVADIRIEALTRWLLVCISILFLHWKSYYQYRLSFRDAILAALIAFCALHDVWVLCALFFCFSYFIKLEDRANSDNWWLAYIRHYKLSIFFTVIGLLLVATLPWLTVRFSHLLLPLSISLFYWILSRFLKGFDRMNKNYGLVYLPIDFSRNFQLMFLGVVFVCAIYLIGLLFISFQVFVLALFTYVISWYIWFKSPWQSMISTVLLSTATFLI